MVRYLTPLALTCFLFSPAIADDAPKKEKPAEAAEKPADKPAAKPKAKKKTDA